MKEGALVKYRQPIEEGEENLVMIVLEDREERMLVMDFCDSNYIPRTWNARTEELMEIKTEEL